ncbi:metallophosphoesterase 1 isoform X2 [Arachis ipaensis]|uniref:metallophosphoesterase 1 isoform X2 n=1 Tax=Arachis ipaensis TaxID=130454 RepID=UPI000A2B723E|nr:metallophosphoesterase 1 isoform X2 [Arachis ipaensis]
MVPRCSETHFFFQTHPCFMHHSNPRMGVTVGLKVLSLVAIASLLVFEEWVSTPACNLVDPFEDPKFEDDPENLKVMLVADLLLLGSESGYLSVFFRDYYISKFFRKSFESLKPDLLLVLGDVSAKGSELTRSKWTSVLQQFYQILGPFVDLPFHAVLGDRDIGDCSDLDLNKVNWISSKLPGLDPSGCGAFEINNISFVTLNAVALLCGNNSLRFGIEKVIERESLEFRDETGGINDSINTTDANYNFMWRVHSMPSGSGPVILLHFPLKQTGNQRQGGIDTLKRSPISLIEGLNEVSKPREHIGAGVYKLLHTLPQNASEYILQALKPRIIFSAHSHSFSDHVHFDQTREITVPAMSWNARDDPGFVFATFQKTGN